jgi:hypothetical protein
MAWQNGLTRRFDLNGTFDDALTENNGTPGYYSGGAQVDPSFIQDDGLMVAVFDGNNHLDIGNVNLSGSFSIAAWLKCDDWDSIGTSHKTWFGTDGTTGYKRSIHLQAKKPGKTLKFGFYQDDLNINDGSYMIPEGAWAHVVATYDYATDTSSLYVDGLLKGSANKGPFLPDFGTYTAKIGAWSENYNNGNGWTGKIGYVAIWEGTAISAQDVSDLHALGRSLSDITSDLEGHWTFDDGTADDSAGTNHGTLEGPSIWTYKGRKGLNLSDNYVDLGSPAALQISTNLTISTWFKSNGNSMDGDMISTAGDDGTNGYRLGIKHDDESELVFLIGDASGYDVVYSNNANINDNQWHKVAATYDGSDLKLYIDGVFNNSTPCARTITYANNLNFGRRPTDGDGNHNYFNSFLDEIRIYSRALSEMDVVALWEEELLISTGLVSKYNCSDLLDSYGDRDLTLNGAFALASVDNRTVCDAGPWYFVGEPERNVGWATPSSPIPISSKFTASLWFKEIREPLQGYHTKDLFPTGDGSGGLGSSLLQIGSYSANNGQSDHLNFIGARTDNNEASELGSDIDINYSLYDAASGWHQIVVTLDNGSALQIWLDGVKHGSPIYGDFSSMNEIMSINGGWFEPFARYVDDIRFWNRLLSDQEIASMYLQKPVITLIGDGTIEIDQGGTFVDPGVVARDSSEEDISQDVTITIVKNHPYYVYEEDLSSNPGEGWNDNSIIQYSAVRDDNGAVISSKYMHGRFGAQTLSKDVDFDMTVAGNGDDIVINGKIFLIDSWDNEAFRVYVDDQLKLEFTAQHGQNDIIQSITTGSEHIVDSYHISDFVDHTTTGSDGGERQDNWGGEGVVEFSIPVLDIDENPAGGTDMTIYFMSMSNGSISDESWGVGDFDIQKVAEDVQSVDANSVGNYNIYYNVLDSMNIAATQVTRVVRVQDVTFPSIILNGDQNMFINEGDTFVDPGVSISDDVQLKRTTRVPAWGEQIVIQDNATNLSAGYTLVIGEDQVVVDAKGVHHGTIMIEGTAGTVVNETVDSHEALTFPGVGTYLELPSSLNGLTGSSEYTLMGWVYPTDQYGYRGIFLVNGTGLVMWDAGRVGWLVDGGNASLGLSNADKIPMNAWTHVALTYSDSNGAKIYINGVDKTGIETETGWGLAGRSGIALGYNNDNFVGSMRSLRFYSTELDASEINMVKDLAAMKVGAVRGVYTVSYEAEDFAGNVTGPIVRTITVVPDLTPPVITLNGAQTINIFENALYEELGATAIDATYGSTPVLISKRPVGSKIPSIQHYYSCNDTSNYFEQYNSAVLTDVAVVAGGKYDKCWDFTSWTNNVDDSPNAIIPNPIPTTSDYTVSAWVKGLTGETHNGHLWSSKFGSALVNHTGPCGFGKDGSIMGTNMVFGFQNGNRAQFIKTDVSGEEVASELSYGWETGGLTWPDVRDSIDINAWNHFAISVDFATNTARVYINGVLRGRVTDGTVIPRPQTIDVIGTGLDCCANRTGTPFAEFISDFAVYNSVLSDADILNISQGVVKSRAGAGSAVGTYSVTYSSTDLVENQATLVRTVNVLADTTPPVIVLNGDATVSIPEGGSYSELGATASDNASGDITNHVVISGQVLLDGDGITSGIVSRYGSADGTDLVGAFNGTFYSVTGDVTNGGRLSWDFPNQHSSKVLLEQGYLDTSGDWTFSMWFYNLSSTSWRTGIRSGTNGDHHIIIQNGGTELGAYRGGFHGCGFNMDSANFTGWHHIAVTASGNSMLYYVDGQYVGSVGFKSSGHICVIGNYQHGGQRFAEAIADPRFYNREISLSEIQSIFNHSGSLGTGAAVNGSYQLTYSATDDAGNIGTAIRTVNVGEVSVDISGEMFYPISHGLDSGGAPSSFLFKIENNKTSTFYTTADANDFDKFTERKQDVTAIDGIGRSTVYGPPGLVVFGTSVGKLYELAMEANSVPGSLNLIYTDNDGEAINNVQHGKTNNEWIFATNNGKVKTIPQGGGVATARLDLNAIVSPGAKVVDIAEAPDGVAIVSRKSDFTFDIRIISSDWTVVSGGGQINAVLGDIIELNYNYEIDTWVASSADGTVVTTDDLANWLV